MRAFKNFPNCVRFMRAASKLVIENRILEDDNRILKCLEIASEEIYNRGFLMHK